MPFDFNIPITGTDIPIQITIAPGELLFVLGANGTGKSSLMHRLYSQHHQAAIRISAHRQTWLHSNALTLTAQQKLQTEKGISNSDRTPDSRWKDDYSSQRTNIAIYDLIDAENTRARDITKAVDEDNLEGAKKLSNRQAPLSLINDLLRLSNLPIELSLHKNEQIMARKNGSEFYSVAELSDGERNAVLIAATVLTANTGALIIVDEPERHLHRSIISPLLSHLFTQRDDCAFVVSTHEVMLPIDNERANTLILRDCDYHNKQAVSWQADIINQEQEIDDELKIQIFGSRRRMLFVEGVPESLDKPLYAILFPDVSVVPKAGCSSLINTVKALKEEEDLHWLSPFGIIDNDNRSHEEIEKLSEQGVFALSLHTVEAIYYHPLIQWAVGARQAEVTGANVDDLVTKAKTDAIARINEHLDRMSHRVAERTIRELAFKNLPTKTTIAEGKKVSLELDVPGEVAAEQKRILDLLTTEDLMGLLSRYPIRETGALGGIANTLGFRDRLQYQAAVQKFLLDNENAAISLRGLFGNLSEKIMD